MYQEHISFTESYYADNKNYIADGKKKKKKKIAHLSQNVRSLPVHCPSTFANNLSGEAPMSVFIKFHLEPP